MVASILGEQNGGIWFGKTKWRHSVWKSKWRNRVWKKLNGGIWVWKNKMVALGLEEKKGGIEFGPNKMAGLGLKDQNGGYGFEKTKWRHWVWKKLNVVFSPWTCHPVVVLPWSQPTGGILATEKRQNMNWGLNQTVANDLTLYYQFISLGLRI